VDEEQRRKVLVGAAALARAIVVDVDAHNEVSRVSFCGAPIFFRDERGLPRVLGIRFPRWIRGPRKD
jgi:hypothetical protein